MITVAIAINSFVLFARSARNDSVRKDGKTKYVLDTGEVIYHKREDGAVKLAKLMLDTINENMDEKVKFKSGNTMGSTGPAPEIKIKSSALKNDGGYYGFAIRPKDAYVPKKKAKVLEK